MPRRDLLNGTREPMGASELHLGRERESAQATALMAQALASPVRPSTAVRQCVSLLLLLLLLVRLAEQAPLGGPNSLQRLRRRTQPARL